MIKAKTIRDARIDGVWWDGGRECVVSNAAIEVRSDIFVPLQDVDDTPFSPGLLRVDAPRDGVCRVGLFNGVGTGYGDTIAGSVAVRALYETIEATGVEPRIELYPIAGKTSRYIDVFGLDPHVYSVQSCGVYVEDSPHYCATTEGMIADKAFRQMDMVDYFLYRLGQKEWEGDKRPRVYLDPDLDAIVTDAIECVQGKTLLLNYFASGHRRLPIFIWEPLAKMFAADGWQVLLNAGPEDLSILQTFYNEFFTDEPNIHYIADLPANSFGHLMCLVNAVDAVVTPDTSIMHIAGALGKPCAAAFFSIEPEQRITYYPTVKPWVADSFRRSEWWGRDKPPQGVDGRALDDEQSWIEPWKRADLRLWRARLDAAVRGD